MEKIELLWTSTPIKTHNHPACWSVVEKFLKNQPDKYFWREHQGLKKIFIKTHLPNNFNGFFESIGWTQLEKLDTHQPWLTMLPWKPFSNDFMTELDDLKIIAGPCAITSYEQLEQCAQVISANNGYGLRAGAFKPRSSPYTFQGIGVEGLKWMAEICKQYKLKSVSEVMGFDHLDAAVQYVDILQIGSRNMQNFALLKKIGQTGKPVFLKRHFSANYHEWFMAAEYLLSEGCKHLILCERGIRTFETATRFTLDLNAIPYIKKKLHVPIFVDPSHGTGCATLVTPMAKAAVACGADGLMIEAQMNPVQAPSDKDQTLSLEALVLLMKQTQELHQHVHKKVL